MARGGIGDDGLIQRMQLLVWPDVDRVWHNVDRPPDRRARRIASELFSRLDAFDSVALGIGQDDTEGAVPLLHEAGTIPCLRFDPEAQAAFDAWRAGLEGRLRTGELHSALEAHLSKYRSLVPSLALLCHLADNGRGPVGPVAVQRALAWAEYLESHARRVYDSVVRGDLCAARVLGEHILSGDLTSPFALRDVYRPGWTQLTTREAAMAAIGVLIDLDWIHAQEVKTGPAGGRPPVRYVINHKLAGGRP
jgi:hypothetical protein